MSDAIIQVRGLHKVFVSGDRHIKVLRGVDLELLAGESVSIRGESGSGKSTLLNLLAGLDRADRGDINWEGVSDLAPQRRARFLGMIFQSFYLIPELDARQNILMACRIAGPLGAEEKARTELMLARVGLTDRSTHLPAQLSGGERQRVAIARALINSPRVVLADEPTGNLDEQTGESVINLLLELCREDRVSLVLVTHNRAHAERTSRQLLLQHGQLAAVEPPAKRQRKNTRK